MRKFLLVALLALFSTGAQAQCIGAGNPLTNALPGMNCNSEPIILSYQAAGFGIVPAASATDLACITGSATRVTRLQSFKISGTAGTLVTLPIQLTKHSVANTGGTPAATTALPVPIALDSNNAAATATTTAYTANPTVDASAVIIDTQTVSFNTTAALVNGPTGFFDFSQRLFSQKPTLRGVAQQLCLNLGGISISSGLLAVSIAWTEAAQ